MAVTTPPGRVPVAVGTACALILAVAGCAGSDAETQTSSSTSATTKTASSSSTATMSGPPPTSTSSTTRATATPSTASAPTTSDAPTAAVGAQTCGAVTSTVGETVNVEIIVGEVDCAFAEGLLDTYYNNPPTLPAGSGGYVDIGEWNCNSSSSQPENRASTCRTAAGDEIITLAPASAAPAESPTGSASATPGGAPSGDPGGSACALIDQPTLENMFPDGNQDEQLCRNFMGDGFPPAPPS